MIRIDRNVDKNVQSGDLRVGDGNQATMGIVHQQIASKRSGGIVIYAAGAIGHIAHDQGLGARTELRQDIRYGRRKHEQTFWHLQSDSFGLYRADAMYGLVDFERVVRRQQAYCRVDIRVIEYVCRDLVQSPRSPRCWRTLAGLNRWTRPLTTRHYGSGLFDTAIGILFQLSLRLQSALSDESLPWGTLRRGRVVRS